MRHAAAAARVWTHFSRCFGRERGKERVVVACCGDANGVEGVAEQAELALSR